MSGIALSFVISLPVALLGQDATSYQYDALGRLVEVSTSGGPCGSPQSAYSLDPAGNRTSVTVTGAVPCTRKVIVLPINGYTVIPLSY